MAMLQSKYTSAAKKTLEEICRQLGYTIRYEKGNFTSSSCLVEERKLIVINKFHDRDGQIEALLSILRDLNFDMSQIETKLVKKFQMLLEL